MKNYRVEEISQAVHQAGFYPLDVLLIGATGVGKSTTLNALFGQDIAKKGDGVDPETMLVNSYQLHDTLRFWDSPGLGDGKAADLEHSKKLIDTLWRSYTHSDGTWGFIDLVIVVLDASSRDLGTTYHLLEQVILKNIQGERVMVCLNQADMAMKGRHWDAQLKKPTPTLQNFLDEKVISIQRRLLEATGLNVRLPVYYSAEEQYNLKALMDHLINHLPNQKRELPKVG